MKVNKQVYPVVANIDGCGYVTILYPLHARNFLRSWILDFKSRRNNIRNNDILNRRRESSLQRYLDYNKIVLAEGSSVNRSAEPVKKFPAHFQEVIYLFILPAY